MPLTFLSGDPLLTEAQTLAFSHNAAGRIEHDRLHNTLMRRYPAAFSRYKRDCRKGKIHTGHYWLWREAQPYLMFLPVRETAVGATRLRYVQTAIVNIARDYRLERLESLALTNLGQPHEWDEIKMILTQWLGKSKLPVVVYEDYLPGEKAAEDWAR